jgi:hypothetical protein
MTDKVWLVMPSADADDDWQPRCVFATWQLAVSTLAQWHSDVYGHEVEVHAEVSGDGNGMVTVTSDDEEWSEVTIVALLVERGE